MPAAAGVTYAVTAPSTTSEHVHDAAPRIIFASRSREVSVAEHPGGDPTLVAAMAAPRNK
jgi:hypothetical protein